MEATGEGDNDSSSSSFSFTDGCPLFEMNPRKGSLYLEEEELEFQTRQNEKQRVARDKVLEK